MIGFEISRPPDFVLGDVEFVIRGGGRIEYGWGVLHKKDAKE